MLDGDSLILFDVMKVVLIHVLSYYGNPLIRLIIRGSFICMYIFVCMYVFDSVILKMAAATYSEALIAVYRNAQRSGCEQRTFRSSDFFFFCIFIP